MGMFLWWGYVQLDNVFKSLYYTSSPVQVNTTAAFFTFTTMRVCAIFFILVKNDVFILQLHGNANKARTLVLHAFGRAGQHLWHCLFQLFREIRAFRLEIVPHHHSHRFMTRQ